MAYVAGFDWLDCLSAIVLVHTWKVWLWAGSDSPDQARKVAMVLSKRCRVIVWTGYCGQDGRSSVSPSLSSSWLWSRH